MMKISEETMTRLGSYMDDEKRETVYAELAPCTPEEFLTRYLELDLEFEEFMKNELNVEL